MDPFAALLAKQNPSEAEGEVDSDPFNALLKRGAKPALAGKPGEIPTRAPGQPPGPTGGPAQPEAPEPTTLGRLIRRKGWLELGADVADIVVGGIPALVAGSYADLDQRMQALIKGQGWRAGGKAGAEASRQIGEAIGRPVYDNLVAAGLIDKGTRSIPMQAMDKVGSFLERSAETFEHDTGMPKEDYLSLVNGFMGAMGVKGAGALVKHGVQVPGMARPLVKGLDQRVAESKASAWDAALERYNAEEQLAREKFEARTPERKAAEAAFKAGSTDPLYGGNFAAEAAARKEAFLRRKAREKGIADFPPSGERTGSRDGILLNLEGKETPTSRPGNQPFHTADTTAALKRGIVADTPIETQGRLTPAGQTSLDSGLAKVREGRLFDMTPEERIAVKGSREITDPKIITAAAVGATGLGLAMLYEPSPEEAAMAIGAGALLRRGGKGETLAELRAYPDATPLGALLEPSAYTTRTLERLADASPGRFEFKKAQVEQLLKQSDVTAHERGIMREVLDSAPGETITAKQLMVGMRTAIGDFELTPEKSDSYADYGLENIGREALNPDLAVELDLPAGGHGDLQPTTRIYRSPLKLGSNNHFGDPNYFAHTRSFVEDGVRHVVELQSDLAQKAGKVLKPEERTQLKAEYDRLTAANDKVREERLEFTLHGRRGSERFAELTVAAREYITRMREIEAKLAESGELTTISPMLKDWHKRLVREELADAARNLEGSVRFATADTVAKVEGWPDSRDNLGLYRQEVKAAEKHLAEVERIRDGHPPTDDYYTALQTADPEGYARFLDGIGIEVVAAEHSLGLAKERLAAAEKAPRFRPEHQGIYDRYQKDVEKFLRQLGGQPYTDSAGHTWIEVPLGEQQKALPGGGARTQIGGVDRKVLGALTAMGASAALASWLSDEGKKPRNALLAAAGAAAFSLLALKHSTTPGVAQKAASILRNIEDFAGNTSYQIEKLSPAVLRAVDRYKMGQLVRTQNYLHAATPFVEMLRKASPAAGKKLDAALLTGDWPTAIKALGELGVKGASEELGKIRTLLADVGKDLLSSTAIRGLVDNHYPRVVADLDGLLGALGKPAKEFLESAIEQATRKAGRPLDDIELSQVVNKAIETSLLKRGGDGSTFRAGRTIPEVTEDLARFYAPASESLVMYLDWAAKAIERAKFFGKHAVREEATGKLSLDHSIGNVLYELDKKKTLSRADKAELQRLLGVEFTYANQFGNSFLQSWNRLTSASLIANVGSALMNLGDTFQAINMYGLVATVKAIQQTLGRSDGRVTRQMMGLADTIANEFTGADKAPIIVNVPGYGGVRLSTAKFLDGSLKWSGFRALDSFGKQVLSNAAVNAARAQVATPSGLKKFAKDHAAYFGDDLPKLVNDLKSGELTPLTLEYTWRKLSDVQPVTSLDMPTARTANPNFRFLWSLKSYMIKQLTLLRKEGIDKLRRGDADGARFLLRYALIVGGGQATMEWIVNSMWGKNDELTWGDIPLNALKNFGISQYAVEKFQQGKPAEGASALTAPPLFVLLEVLSGKPEAVQRIPVVGKPIYMHALGGAEKANAAKKLQEKKKRRDAERTPEERRELLERALERRKRLLEEQ